MASEPTEVQWMEFVLRQLQENCREENNGLCGTFVDLSKAFDSVSRTLI